MENLNPCKSIILDLIQNNSSNVGNKSSLTSKVNTGTVGVNFNIQKDKQPKVNFTILKEKMENIDLLRVSISNNLKQIENDNFKFFENAKNIFKKLKNLHTQSQDTREGRENRGSHAISPYKKSNPRISQSPINKNSKNDNKRPMNTETGVNSSSKPSLYNKKNFECDDLSRKNSETSNSQLKKTQNEALNPDEKKTFEDIILNLKKNISEMKDEMDILNKKYKKLKLEYQELQQVNEKNVAKGRDRDLKEKRDISLSQSPIPKKLNTGNNTNLNSYAKNYNILKERVQEKSLEHKTRKCDLPIQNDSGNSNLIKIAENLKLFFKCMDELQKAISEKNIKTKELKVTFETKKEELLNFTNKILNINKLKELDHPLLKSDASFNSKIKKELTNSNNNLIPKSKGKLLNNISNFKTNTNTGNEDNSSIMFDIAEKKKLEELSMNKF